MAAEIRAFRGHKEDTEKAKSTLDEWLGKRGLKLSTEKTKITHLKEGFDFLGFNIRQYPVPNTKSGWKLLIKPSKKSVQNIRDKLRQEWLKLIGRKARISKLLKFLNPNPQRLNGHASS
ncbi:MAG: hypothetical protein IGS39_23135 [Calothrix sp. C42_A2020_038]|nr:hypothetical protein [Calothrix sp. C42_A2020_038]